MDNETESVTNWTVLTGGGCSGKSTLANYFQAAGYNGIPEAAETYVEVGSSKGYDPEKLLRSGAREQVPKLDLEMESRRDPEEPLVLDRSLGDSLAFYDKFVGDPAEELVETASNRYDSVIVLDQLEGIDQAEEREQDKTRTNDQEFSREVHEHISDFYEEELGYDIVEVEEINLEERARAVAENSLLEEPDLDIEFFL